MAEPASVVNLRGGVPGAMLSVMDSPALLDTITRSNPTNQSQDMETPNELKRSGTPAKVPKKAL